MDHGGRVVDQDVYPADFLGQFADGPLGMSQVRQITAKVLRLKGRSGQRLTGADCIGKIGRDDFSTLFGEPFDKGSPDRP